MFKRIFGWLLFAWMAMSAVGLVFFQFSKSPSPRAPASIAAGLIILAFLVIGLKMGLGQDVSTGPPKDQG
jgi:hypothetical protein